MFKKLTFKTQDEWLAYRFKSIGGSDVSPIMGQSEYKSIENVAFDKKNKTKYEDTPFTLIGKLMEHPIFNTFVLAKYPDAVATSVETPDILVNDEFPGMHATLDGIAKDRLIEIKFVSMFGTKKWIHPLTGQLAVPVDYEFQVQAYMAITGYEVTSVFAYFQESGICHEFEVKANKTTQEAIRATVARFWSNYEALATPVTAQPEIECVNEELLGNIHMKKMDIKKAELQIRNWESMLLNKYAVGSKLRWNNVNAFIVEKDLKAGKIKSVRY